jgi:hypothetical protein
VVLTSLLYDDRYLRLKVITAEFARFQLSESYVQGRVNKLLDAVSMRFDMFEILS